jgi:hypothetical protein
MKKKIKTSKEKNEFTSLGEHPKRELNGLKEAYKNQKLKFDSNEIAKAILEDKEVRKGLLR